MIYYYNLIVVKEREMAVKIVMGMDKDLKGSERNCELNREVGDERRLLNNQNL